MKISYNTEYDAMYMEFSGGKVDDTIEVEANVLIDYGDNGEIIGIEILNASKIMTANPLQEIVAKIQEKNGNIKRCFSDLLEELGEAEAREDIDHLLSSMRQRSYL